MRICSVPAGHRSPDAGRARRRGAATILAAALALASSGCGGSPEPAPGAGGDFYGVNGVILRAWSSQGLDELVERHLAEVEASGAGFVRGTLGWQRIEPLPPVGDVRRYSFADTDRWVTALARHGLRWSVLGLGVPTPAWAADPSAPARCAGQRPPARPDDLAAVMGAIARRYGSTGSFWRAHPELDPQPILEYEVWNAPNNGGDWCPAPDPEAYADLFAATAAAVEAADPEARVVIGGLGAFDSPDPGSTGSTNVPPGEFLRRALNHRPDLAEAIDAVGIHVYAPDAAGVIAGVVEFRREIDAAGLPGVPLSWNEVGWPTAGDAALPPTPEDERAELIGAVTAAAGEIGCGIVSFAPHTWVTPELDPNDPEDWFGIADPESAEPYPSALAYRDAVVAAKPDITEPGCGA